MSLLKKRIQKLVDDFSGSISELKYEVSPRKVHRLRTTIRRIESLTAGFRYDLGRKQRRTLADLARLRRQAGRVRDLDIEAGLLEAIANRSTASDRRELIEVLKTKRARRLRALVSAVKKLRMSRLSAHLNRIAEKVAANASEDGDTSPLQKAKAAILALALKFQSSQDLKPKRLHEVRIKLKHIRYLAEVEASSADRTRFLKEMKSVQDAIGDWHDWDALLAAAEKQFGDRATCALLMEIRSLFAVRYFAASSAVAHLLSAHAPAAKKQPQPVRAEQTTRQAAS